MMVVMMVMMMRSIGIDDDIDEDIDDIDDDVGDYWPHVYVGISTVHAVYRYQSSGRPHVCVCACARARMPGKGDAGQYQR